MTSFDYQSPVAWQIRLLSKSGREMAHHSVRLDQQSTEFRMFVNMRRELRIRSDPNPALHRTSQADLMDRVGRWAREAILGETYMHLATAPPGPVLVRIPPAAAPLLAMPLELALTDPDQLGPPEQTLVFEMPPIHNVAKERVRSAVRILGVFAVPAGESPLGLRRERRALSQLVTKLQSLGLGVDLRVLQYGVTHELLERALEDGHGWDVVHLASHGFSGGLVLEKPNGRPDPITAAELGKLLSRARARLKLIVVGACDSAAVRSDRLLEQIGLANAKKAAVDKSTVDVNAGQAFDPSLAAQLVRRLSCSVVAMRYPVDDNFAVAFATHLYDALLELGQPFPNAVSHGLRVALETTSAPALSIITPTVLASPFAAFHLRPPKRRAPRIDIDQARKMVSVPKEPTHFVGRTGILAQAGAFQ